MQKSTVLRHPPPALPDDASLFLDFDGTLVDLAEHPDAVMVDDALHALLGRLSRKLEGRVALVSGRSVAQLDTFLAHAADDLAVVGSHGAEIRHAGGVLTGPDRPPALDEAEALFKSAFMDRSGVVVEEKSLGVAVHYRLDPLAQTQVEEMATRFAADHELEIQKGKMMVEIRAGGHDKGIGIAALLDEAPFAGNPPWFLGDDLTDEPGFALCAARGGAGVLIGADRSSAARYRLADVAAVHDWLDGGAA